MVLFRTGRIPVRNLDLAMPDVHLLCCCVNRLGMRLSRRLYNGEPAAASDCMVLVDIRADVTVDASSFT